MASPLWARSGTFSDGPGNYAENQDCVWLITCAPQVDITLHFTMFEVYLMRTPESSYEDN